MRFLSLLAVLLSLGASVARADSIILQNGAKYEGILKTVSPKLVVIQSDGAEWTFARDKVISIKYDQAEASHEKTRAHAALNKSQARARNRDLQEKMRRNREQSGETAAEEHARARADAEEERARAREEAAEERAQAKQHPPVRVDDDPPDPIDDDSPFDDSE